MPQEVTKAAVDAVLESIYIACLRALVTLKLSWNFLPFSPFSPIPFPGPDNPYVDLIALLLSP